MIKSKRSQSMNLEKIDRHALCFDPVSFSFLSNNLFILEFASLKKRNMETAIIVSHPILEKLRNMLVIPPVSRRASIGILPNNFRW